MNYLRSLISAVMIRRERKIQPVLFVDPAAASRLGPGFDGVEIISHRIFERHSLAWFVRKVLARALRKDVLLERQLQRGRIDILSHSGCIGRGAHIPAIGWIADLQHRRLPELFDESERKNRDSTIARWCRDCAALIFSSESARVDFAELYEAPELPIFVIPFVPSTHRPKPGVWKEVLRKYGLPERYFYVPNQFWVHKNHRAVLDAAVQLHGDGVDVDIVFTGDTNDRLNPGHPAGLRKLGASIDSRLHFLGLVPYEDVVALMDGAVAIINPSRFEGRSTTVEEAINLGKSVLLSDIAVHIEQAPPRAIYFKLDDNSDLSGKMRKCWLEYDPEVEHALRHAHIPDVVARRCAYGESFERCVLSVLGHGNPVQ